jgi:PD-(D/E)XK endonuclease
MIARDHPKAIGDRTTLAVMLVLQAAGIPFSIPFGENTRYDLLIEDGDSVARVQCKTGRLISGTIVFHLCSYYAHHPRPKPSRNYHGEVEYFAVFCPATSGVYLVPIEDLHGLGRQGTLRVDATRNNQRRKVRPASRYQLGRVSLEVLRPGPRATAGAG